MSLAAHANGAPARCRVEVASRQTKKKDAPIWEEDINSLDTDDTVARQLGHTPTPRGGKGQRHAMTTEAVGAVCRGADSKALTDLVVMLARERVQWQELRNKERQSWYKERCDEQDVWDKERRIGTH